MNNYIIVSKLSDDFNDDSSRSMLIAVDGIRHVLRVCEGMSKIKIGGFDEFYIKESPETIRDLIYADSSNPLRVGF